jgi:hypothetical protein
MHLWRHQNRRLLRRRLCAACTLVAYLAASLGLPLPAGAMAKDGGRAFPCQQHACGCRTAEQCWSRCCCFSPEQRWTWAETQDVQPPSYAEKPATTSWRSVRKRDQGQNCCSKSRPASPTCQTCPETQPSPKPESPKQAPPAKSDKFRWVLGMSALACQGATTLWVTTASVLPAAPPVTWTPCPVLVARISYNNETAFYLSLLPPDRPPRLGHV